MDKANSFINMRERYVESAPRILGYTLRALLLLLLGLAPVMGQTVAQQMLTRLKERGDWMKANAPLEVKNGSTLKKAKYVFEEYCSTLNGSAVSFVNSNLVTQQIGRRYGDVSMFQCGWHTDRLKELMSCMGISDKDMRGIVADAHSALHPVINPNQEHGALAVRDDDGEIYIFDPWKMAVNNVIVSTGINPQAYAGAKGSEWNGMKALVWETKMRPYYIRFNDQLQLDTNYSNNLQKVLDRIFGAAPESKKKWVLDGEPVIGGSTPKNTDIRIDDTNASCETTIIRSADGAIIGTMKATFAFTPPPKEMIPNEKISITVKGDYSGKNDISSCQFRIGSKEILAAGRDYVVLIGLNAPGPHGEMTNTFLVPENLEWLKGKITLDYTLTYIGDFGSSKKISYTYSFKKP